MTMTPSHSILVLAFGAALFAGAAHAEIVLRPVAAPAPGQSRPLDLSRAHVAEFGEAAALGDAVLPKRSIDYRFAPKDVVGSVGFLCGREPGQGVTGSAAAFGVDPHGRFLGAKLSRAF